MSPTPWDLPERIRSKIAVDADTGCWLWTGAKALGYGVAWDPLRRTAPAHRVVYEMIAFVIPDALELDHLCRVRSCVSPAHLEPVTHVENVSRSAHVLRTGEAVFPCGHPRTLDNSYACGKAGGKVKRQCRACHIARVQRHKAARRAQAAA